LAVHFLLIIYLYFNAKMNIISVIVAIAALVIGAAVAWFYSQKNAKSKASEILEKARMEAQVLKNEEVLKGKEEGMNIKNAAEKQANQRLAQVQSNEAKLKQREINLNQQQGDMQRRRNELDTLKLNLDNQTAVLDERKKEVDKMEKSVRETLEHVSGLSAEEAKEKLVESLKDEAKTDRRKLHQRHHGRCETRLPTRKRSASSWRLSSAWLQRPPSKTP